MAPTVEPNNIRVAKAHVFLIIRRESYVQYSLRLARL